MNVERNGQLYIQLKDLLLPEVPEVLKEEARKTINILVKKYGYTEYDAGYIFIPIKSKSVKVAQFIHLYVQNGYNNYSKIGKPIINYDRYKFCDSYDALERVRDVCEYCSSASDEIKSNAENDAFDASEYFKYGRDLIGYAQNPNGEDEFQRLVNNNTIFNILVRRFY